MVGADSLATHGDLTHLFTTAGVLADSSLYDPFGDVIGTSGSVNPTVGFQSDYTDPASEHVWMGARWYDSGWATFLSRDQVFGELSTPISLNRYTYAAANPLRYWDPDGRIANCVSFEGSYCAEDVVAGSQDLKKLPGTTSNATTIANAEAAVTLEEQFEILSSVLTSTNAEPNPASLNWIDQDLAALTAVASLEFVDIFGYSQVLRLTVRPAVGPTRGFMVSASMSGQRSKNRRRQSSSSATAPTTWRRSPSSNRSDSGAIRFLPTSP